MEILRKRQKEMLEMKTLVTEMENAFDGFLSRLGMAKGRSLGQRMYQYNPQKLKNKESKTGKN